MPDMDLSSMKEGTKATPSYCYWSPATEQAQETENATEIATEIEGWCAPSRHDPKVCREKYCSPWRAGEAGNRGHKKQKPGREPGLPLNVTL
jgi:hypothetical protein